MSWESEAVRWVGRLFRWGVVLVFCATVALLVLLLMGSEGRAPHGNGAVAEEGRIEAAEGGGWIERLSRMLGKMLPKNGDEQPNGTRTVAGTLEEAGTDLRHTVEFRVENGHVCYRLWLEPYERQTHQFMQAPEEALFVSFHDESGQRVVPESVADRVPMRKMAAAKKSASESGWYYDGVLPLKGADPDSLEAVKVGWIFSPRLHAYLRRLKEHRAGEVAVHEGVR